MTKEWGSEEAEILASGSCVADDTQWFIETAPGRERGVLYLQVGGASAFAFFGEVETARLDRLIQVLCQMRAGRRE